MAPAVGGDLQFGAAERHFDSSVAALSSDVDLVVDVDRQSSDDSALGGQLHPEHAPSAPALSAFAKLGPIIATGHPALKGNQVRVLDELLHHVQLDTQRTPGTLSSRSGASWRGGGVATVARHHRAGNPFMHCLVAS